MDINGSKYKCEHSKYECPYKDCNYHYRSTGKYSHKEPHELPYYYPLDEEEAKTCLNYMDI